MASSRIAFSSAGEESLRGYYQQLLHHLGSQDWWPARTRLEVILGAILTQNTAWRNASLVLSRLRRAGLLQLGNLRRTSAGELESYIRQAGFYRQKAAAILNFIEWLDQNYCGSLYKLFSVRSEELRKRLLELKGLGPETVDAILLYAGRRPFFVADAYTRRILSRHGWLPRNASYDMAQALLHRELPRDPQVFNEFHALLVETGKRYCKRRAPACSACPLRVYLPGTSSAHNAEAALALQITN